MTESNPNVASRQSPLREIVQPLIDFARAPRALWGVNLAYWLDGFVYFGMLGYMAMYFNQYVALSDIQAGWMLSFLTSGITVSMFFMGGLADRWGARTALLLALALMAGGRVFIAAAPFSGLSADGVGSGVFLVAVGGMLLIILGNGLFQPASYAAVRQITTEKTAAMGYAMLYALMNLGGWMPVFFAPIRRATGISGTYVVYTLISVSVLLLTALVLSRKTMERAVAAAAGQREKEEAEKEKQAGAEAEADSGAEGATDDDAKTVEPAAGAVQAASPESGGFFAAARDWVVNHPLADLRFSFFIFALIPVQTLFAHNWLTIPMYVERAYRGSWIGANFEAAVSSNMLLVFILVPLVTAATRKAKVYNMMIAGTFVMGAPAFLLALGPSVWNLAAYILLMTIGEAMWQPRFLQYAAEIAPEGRTGAYIGVAMFPWFMTKLITGLYSGWFLARYCPSEGELNTEFMWLIYGLIAISSTVMLVVARRWAGKGIDAKGVRG